MKTAATITEAAVFFDFIFFIGIMTISTILVTKLIFMRYIGEGGEKVADFQEVYNLYFREVYRYSLSLCRNESMAEEITQETFYKEK